MIKLLSTMKTENPEQYEKVYDELLNHPEAGSFVCRFSFGELQKTANFLSLNSWSVNPEVVYKKFNSFERSVIESIISVGTSEAKLQGRERLVRTAIQRTSRAINHILGTIKEREEIEKLSAKISQKGQANTNARKEWENLQSIFS